MKRIYILALLIYLQVHCNAQIIMTDDFSNRDNWNSTTIDLENELVDTMVWHVGYDTDFYMGDFYSSTADNGYAIFNSGLDSGSVQYAYIMYNNSIAVDGLYPLHIKFEQYYKNYGTDSEINYVAIYSTVADSWYYIKVNTGFAQDEETSNPDLYDIDLSSYITGPDSIFVAFMYYSTTGYNYAWYIDDVTLYNYLDNDAEVSDIYTLGKLPVKYGTPHTIKARISNKGNRTLTSLPVTLNITGANPFSDMQVIEQLEPDSSIVVWFKDFSPVALGINSMTVSVPDDEYNANNASAFRQEVTYNTYSYADTAVYDNSYGISDGSGMTLVKFHINEPKTVRNIKVFLAGSRSVEKNVYAVLLDNKGNMLARSAKYQIQVSDLDKYHNFNLDTFPVLENTEFYVGLAQIEAGSGYWPVAIQSEEGSPMGGNYWAGDLVPTSITQSTDNYRALIEAVMGDPAPEICLLTTDMVTDKNTVVWEKPVSGSIKKYNIYRVGNIAQKYDLIGEVPYENAGIFVDPKANPRVRQYSYKISFTDTMNVETEYSPFHKTLHLSYNGGKLEGKVNLIWQTYEVQNRELQFDSYIIYKNIGIDSVNLVPIDTVPGDSKSYTDFDPNALQFRTFYRLAGVLANPCDPFNIERAGVNGVHKKAGGGVYAQSVSNMEDNRLRTTIGISDVLSLSDFFIYPNPCTEKVTASYILKNRGLVTIEIYNQLGNRVYGKLNGFESAGAHIHVLNVGDLSSMRAGVYIVRLKTPDGILTRLLVKK